MKFQVNIGNFKKGLMPAFDVATKQADKEVPSAFLINLRVDEKEITATAYGGTASIVSTISNDTISELKYEYEEEGEITVRVKDLAEALDSFVGNRDMKVNDKTNKLVLDMITGPKEITRKQKVVPSKEKVRLPKMAKNFDKEVKVYRDIFVQGLSKVAFAMGWEDTNPRYECLLFDVKKDMIRLASGTGARFAVDDITGNGVLDGVEETSFIFPKNNIANLINLLKSLSNEEAEKITVKQASASKDNPEQIVVETDKKQHVLCLFGIDTSNVQYKDVNIFVDNKYPYAFTSKLESWALAAKGAKATYSEEMERENDILNVQIAVDFSKDIVEITSKYDSESETTIPFEIIKNNGEDKAPIFRCNVNYLTEVASRHMKSGDIIMEIDEEKANGKRAPIVVRFPDEVNQSRGTTEKFTIFFATAKK